MDRTLRFLGALTSALLLLAAPAVRAGATTLQTWHPWQLDSVLVAWVLARTRSPAPQFESLPRGTVIAAEIAIDTPDSSFRRNAQRTAFEEALRLERLQHPCVARLREVVRLVEFAAWRRPEFPALQDFEARVLAAAPAQPARGLTAALAEIDRYCAEGGPR
jgi:hypothetical protein